MDVKGLIVTSFIIVGTTALGIWCFEGKKSKDISGHTQKVIAIAEIMQETNSFSPVKTTKRDFQAGILLYGKSIIERSIEEGNQIAGFLEAIEDYGEKQIEIVPILKAVSMSGGPLRREIYEDFKKTVLSGLRSMKRLHGVYLSLHGAMGVDGIRDPEGDLLRSVRGLIGTEIPIGVSYDLHANVTREQVKHASFIVGYKTNPHRDHFETGYRTGEILIKTILGRVKPVMAFNKMRLLKGGGMTIDFLSPMRKIFNWMNDMEESDEVLCLSNFMVHIWLDDPELGWSTVAVTDNNPIMAKKLADELADRNWAVRDVQHPRGHSPSEGIEIARKSWLLRKLGTVIFCDVSDAVGAGAPGENTWILKALIEEGSDLTSYLTLRDEDATGKAFECAIGQTTTLTVGGKLDTIYSKSLTIRGEVIFKTKNRLGKTAILKHGGIHLILSELPASSWSPDFFTELGLSLWKADIVVVKNLFPFRYRYILYNRKTVDVITPGITNVDVFQLKYEKINRPIHPLDRVISWRLN